MAYRKKSLTTGELITDPLVRERENKKGGNAPVPPDYVGAARTQGELNIQTALANALMGQANQITPFGSQTYRQTGTRMIPGIGGSAGFELPSYTSEIMLSPAEQQKLESQQRIGQGLLGKAEERLGQPYNIGGLDQMQAQAEDVIASRLEPRLAKAREQREADLMIRGHARGGEAWKRAQEDISFQETDARRQMILDALRIRPQMIQEETALRGMPLSELAALQGGSAVSMPQFQQFGQGGAAPSPIFGATQAQAQAANQLYSTEQAQQAQQQQGLASLAALAYMLWSDKRLKQNIRRLKAVFKGFNLYEFDYVWGGPRRIGVMADEVLKVKPEAVVNIGGYLAVNYAAL